MRLKIVILTVLLTVAAFLAACATAGEAPPTNNSEDWIERVHAIAGEMRPDINASGLQTLAVLDFSAEEGYAAFVRSLNEELTAAFRSAGVRLIEREAIETVMAEQAYQLSGNVDDATAKRIGMIIGVDMLCFGRIADFPGFVRVSSRVIDVQSGELLSVRNIELAKTPRLLAYLSGSRQGTGQPARPAAPQTQSPSNVTAAAVPENRPMLDLSGSDFESEAGQIAAVREFIPFVVDNLWDISIVSVEPLGNSRDKPDEYLVKLTWQYADRDDTVRAIADFYRRFPAQTRPYATGGGLLRLNYYPTSYASQAETVAIRMHSNAAALMHSSIYLGFYWDVTFTLFDKSGLPIDSLSGIQTRITLSSSPSRLGRLGQTRDHTFRMSKEAYENMDAVRVSNIRGGIPQRDGSFFYR